jgi:uncharacterized membrane protein YoaK (UPF0700 family)
VSRLEASSDNTVWQACLLAIVAGYADAVGFLVFNAFAGAMTGNTVLLGIALADNQFAAAAESAGIIAAFVVGVAASALLRRHIPLAALPGLETAAIVAAALVMPLVAAPVLAFAMGLQNAGAAAPDGMASRRLKTADAPGHRMLYPPPRPRSSAG